MVTPRISIETATSHTGAWRVSRKNGERALPQNS
jgi:hypothetical protein